MFSLVSQFDMKPNTFKTGIVVHVFEVCLGTIYWSTSTRPGPVSVTFKIVYLAQFLADLNDLSFKVYVKICFIQNRKNLKLMCKTFVRLLIKQQYFVLLS